MKGEYFIKVHFKIGVPVCHDEIVGVYERFGQRYRDNGYRLMDREDEERTVLTSPTPVD